MAKEDTKKKEQKKGSNEQREEVLQGIVLGDSFDRRFSPITLERPRTLLPLVNIPLLDYTLELLASGGVQQIFVLCCAHADQIKKYIETSRWSKLPGVKVEAVIDKNSKSTGDALRNIYSYNIIQSDFVLISGDVVSNMNISNALKVHKERREKDKSVLMTMVFKQASPSHRTRSKQDDIVVGFNRDTAQLVHYENSPKKKNIRLPSELFTKNPSIQLRYDLIDCHIDICSPEIMASEILDYKMSTYVLQGEYAARVKDLRTYHSVSKDIIHRWTFPMVPDNNFMCNTTYTLSRQMIYKERKVIFHDCVVGEETVIGKDTEIGDGTVVSHSIIGRNVKIGNNVKIHGAYLWDGVVIEDNATVTKSIICERAVIKANATVSEGSIVSFGVVIGENAFIEPFTKITMQQPGADDDDDYDGEPTEVMTTLGMGGKGRRWTLANGPFNELVPRNNAVDAAGNPVQTDNDSSDDNQGDTDTDSDSSVDKPPIGGKKDPETDHAKFYREVASTVRRGISEKHNTDNISLEVNSLKFAFDRDFLDTSAAVLRAVLNVPNRSTMSLNEHVVALKSRIAHLAAVLQKFLSEDQDVHVDFIFKIQDLCDEDDVIKPLFKYVLHSLHDKEVLAEEAILSWADELDGDDDEESKEYLSLCADFLTWLRDAEEESDDEEEDEEDDDEEEEEEEEEEESESEEESSGDESDD
ncbi:hexapeptide repeat-containing protein [Cavenderia fasciculata]|uniref:Translation initiation factor eIF2B subunit epsilon n=1 Tax=Cavenderia fasciculata TaxID=261658 RepID=F4PTP9_CACFS|nr:hexapeptide repeat-containing protein [Cavenderia fasciculata]EGG21719.1 hexapeptide repeat-containing protein [Cavenderia fasciculata]|eukprot:XP_004359569.1 hexapeptide repeat-containing protein [Cavenderia fasciculata]